MNIEATTILKEGEKYKLEDKDYLMIVAIKELTQAIKQLTTAVRK